MAAPRRDALPAFERSWTTADGARLRATAVASGLEDSTDLLPLPDGRLLVAERAGRVRVVGDDGLLAAAAVTLPDVVVGEGRGLLALALDADFASTRHVFAGYTSEQGLRIARFTLSGERLIDRAIVLDGLPVAAVGPAALLRAGPDGRLYLATDAAGDPDHLFDLGSYSGKILRFTTDGTTPEDQASRSPVWSVGVSHPIGLAWTADRTTLRLIGVEDPESQATRGPSSAAFARGLTRFSLPPAIGATRATLGAGSAVPMFRDQLFVGSAHERAILRVWFDGDVPAGSEWWLRDLPGPVTALGSAADGTIYAAVGPVLLRIAADR
jgi:glucose/arabinose dehydrogenase